MSECRTQKSGRGLNLPRRRRLLNPTARAAEAGGNPLPVPARDVVLVLCRLAAAAAFVVAAEVVGDSAAKAACHVAVCLFRVFGLE